MNLLYNAAIALYGGTARLCSLHSPKVRAMIKGQQQTLARLRYFRKNMAPEGFDAWFHAASLGEFEQARPLIEALLEHRPDAKVLLSFFSPSGYQVRCNYDPRVAVVYLPFDLPENASAFLDAAAPKTAVFIKYEFWGNYLSEIHRRGIPLYLVSAIFRPGQIFFRPWGGMFRDMLKKYRRIYVQDEASRELLSGIGINTVEVIGDTRFDRVEAVRNQAHPVPQIDTFLSLSQHGPVVVAGSSWPQDEQMYIPWLHKHSEVRAIIAPHQFDKQRLTELSGHLGADHTMLLSEFTKLCHAAPERARKISQDNLRYIIVDSFGLLSTLYRYGDFAYVGGGFGAGIHNINEAAVYGIPVIFGPRHKKFNEARHLIERGAGFCIRNANDFERIADDFVEHPDKMRACGEISRAYILSSLGATAKAMKGIFGI